MLRDAGIENIAMETNEFWSKLCYLHLIPETTSGATVAKQQRLTKLPHEYSELT